MVGAAALAAAAPSLRYGFVFDDHYLVQADARLAQVRLWPELFTQSWPRGWETYGYYRPLTALSFAFDRALWGWRAAGFHWTNVLLHAANSVLAWALLDAALGGAGPAGAIAPLAGGIVFALHPLHAEAAAWIAGGRTQLLPAFWALLALLLWAVERRGWAVLAWGVGLLAGEPAAPVPLAFLLWDWLRRPRRERSSPARALLPWGGVGLVAVAYAGIRFALFGAFLRPATDLVSIAPPTVTGRLAELWGLTRAALLPSVPLALSLGTARSTRSVVLGVSELLALAAGLALRRRGAPRAALFAGWFVAFLLPVVPVVVPLYPWEVSARHLYLPCLGAAGLAALGVERLLGVREIRPWIRPALAAAGVLLAVSFVLAEQPWRDDVALWESASGADLNRALAQHNLGRSLCVAGRTQEGLREIRTSRDLPWKLTPARMAQSGFWEAECLRRGGAPEEAERLFRNALLVLASRGAQGRQLGPFHERLGRILLDRGDKTAAMGELKTALDLDPEPNLALVEIVENGSADEQLTACSRAGLTPEDCNRFLAWSRSLPRDVLMELPLLGIRAW